MKKRIIILSIIVLLISILSIMLFNNEENVLENNKINRDKTYAIMVQNEDKTGYIESTSNVFPNDMTLNEELTNCVDESGTKLENPFTYENGIITLRTNKKIYCYLYFDIGSSSGGLEILQNPTNGLNTTLEGGLYRYQGTSVDNYICFGTSDKDTCLGNTDAYMYRIIGITEDGKVKLIKNEALNSTMQWHNNFTSNTTWSNSDLYKMINGSSFLTNTSYMPSEWEYKIETTSWKYGDNTNVNVTADVLYNTENTWANTTNAKVGLMYAHDYAYSYISGGLNCSEYDSYKICKTSWIHLSNCDSGAPIATEWTMSRYGFSGSYYGAWSAAGVGHLYHDLYLTTKYSVRPVFFLKSNVELISGTGKSDDPFIIS